MTESTTTAQLTDWDQALLARHLWFYEGLASGDRQPETKAQEHFIQVIQGRAKPQTQHEIAYTRYLRVRKNGISHSASTTMPADLLPVETVEIEKAVTTIEVAQLSNDKKGRYRDLFKKVKEGYLSGKASVRDHTSQAALWVATLTSESEWSRQIERWSAEQFNNLSNTYSQAMDSRFLSEGVGNPWTHRLLDGGHTLGGSWEAARGALQDDTFWQELRGWSGAFVSDFTSVVGMPITTLSTQSLDYLESTLATLGISQSELVDILSVNAVEAASSIIPALGAIMNWSEPEREEFGKMIGASGLAAIVSANPLLFLVSVVCLARAFHRKRHSSGGLAEWARTVASGGALSGLVLATSSVIAGPVWVGVVSGILAVLILKHAGRSVDIHQLLASIRGVLAVAPPNLVS